MQDTRRVGSKAVIVATGTFLNGLVHTGRRTHSAGRAGEPASIELADSLKELGFPVGRLKTGTPPRLDGRTIDWEAFEPQPPDKKPVAFSFSTAEIAGANQLLHRIHDEGASSKDSRQPPRVAFVFRKNKGNRSSLLSVDRRQSREVCGQRSTSIISGTRRARNERGLPQWVFNLAARRATARVGANDSRS